MVEPQDNHQEFRVLEPWDNAGTLGPGGGQSPGAWDGGALGQLPGIWGSGTQGQTLEILCAGVPVTLMGCP